MKKKNKFFGMITLVGTLLGSSFYAAKYTNLLDGKVSSGVYTESGEIIVKRYNPLKLPPLRCSQFVRMAAKDLFGKNYSSSDAWERRYNDNLIDSVGQKELKNLEEEGVLLPGRIVGFYNPRSRYNSTNDSRGFPVEYTHNALYLGKNIFGNLVFAEQRGEKIRITSLEEFIKEGLTPVEILDSRE